MKIIEKPVGFNDNFKHIIFTPNIWAAGGAVRDSLAGIPYSDVDVFGTDDKVISDFCKANDLNETMIIFKSAIADLYKKNNTLIHVVNYYKPKNIEECLNGFDFSVCMVAYDGKQLYVADNQYLEHINKRKLIIMSYETPLSTFARGIRLMKTRKWIFTKEEIDKLCKHIIAQPDLVAICSGFYT